MSFAGHALDAIKRIEYNRSIKQMHRARYNELKKAVSKIKSKYHFFNDQNQLSEKELRVYKRKIRNNIIHQRQKVIFKSLLITSLILITIFYLTKFLYKLILTSF